MHIPLVYQNGVSGLLRLMPLIRILRNRPGMVAWEVSRSPVVMEDNNSLVQKHRSEVDR